MRVTAADLPVTLFLGIPLPVWDAFWVATDHDTDEYKNAFLNLYHLEIVTIDGGDGEIEVVRPIEGFLPFWVAAALFVVSPSGACLGGCPLSKRPTP